MSSIKSRAREKAVSIVTSRTPRRVEPRVDERGKPLRVSQYFGENTFGVSKMRERLPKDVFQKLLSTIEAGEKLESSVASVVAAAVKDWAIERGATHFCHWFQPQTGLTAEKHDAFLGFDENQSPIEQFSGSQLTQSEPDASSFPSGGMRTTFEARGYTAWDPSSPMFLLESTNTKTLCIPSAFISYHGHALDQKTGLLRSNEALTIQASALLDTIGVSGATRVIATVGSEQEYFLVDREFFVLRPDLLMTGRTLVGAMPPKGQQLEDHYFGSIPSRAQAFMGEVEQELYRLGVPIATRHNEVAPSQFETAPIFEESNVAVDHNHLTMEVLRKVARRHDLEVLLHEKPFQGVNGSGKHVNWSMSISARGKPIDGTNLLEPGKTPQQNIRFLVFLAAILKGVNRYGGLLRSAIASSGNDHRLGANEAPPAIMSVFLGDTLSRILDRIEEAGSANDFAENPESLFLKLGVDKLPTIKRDNTDRNRTSPFAFTGNKFEFRAVGASAPVARAVTYLNVVVAEGLAEMNALIKSKIASAKTKEAAILGALREVIVETKRIRFEGNNYSEEWVHEAARRGLLNLKNTPEALEQLTQDESIAVLTKHAVFSKDEIIARFNARVERYIKDIFIEVNALRNMVDTQILPAGLAYHAELCQGAAAAKAAGITAPQKQTLDRLDQILNGMQSKRATLNASVEQTDKIHDELKKAKELSAKVVPALQDLRELVDELERSMADGYYPYPKYREILLLN